jgi:hypothetical protein
MIARRKDVELDIVCRWSKKKIADGNIWFLHAGFQVQNSSNHDNDAPSGSGNSEEATTTPA